MKIVIGFSPCPNDTFIFDALVNRKINTGDLRFEAQLEDVETLNQLALDGVLPFTKISYAVLSRILNSYVVLNSGSALGSGVPGPPAGSARASRPESRRPWTPGALVRAKSVLGGLHNEYSV